MLVNKKMEKISIEKIKSKIPKYVFEVSDKLISEGYEAYLVGGSVRDIVMGRKPKDYDIGTNALPEDITGIFPKAITTGAKFGAIIVVVEDENEEPQNVDVVTFRTEERYVGGRWPSKVEFTRNIKDDLSRRDFTINAIAINLEKLTKEESRDNKKGDLLLDPFEGMKDIENQIIRAVGDPKERLEEDALRALRACRFASVLGFKLDEKLKDAIPGVLTVIDNLSAERVREEFLKIIYDSPKPSVGLRLLAESGILKIWIPELLEGQGVSQPKQYHVHDVFEHALEAVDHAEDSVKLAALFHDIAKPQTKEGDTFYGHDVKGAKMTKKIMKRLRFSNKEIDRVSRLVRWHMFYFPYDEEAFEKGTGKKKEGRSAQKKIGAWTDSAIRRFVRNVGGEDAIDDLMKLRIADATCNPKSEFDSTEIENLQKRIAEVKEKDMALKVTDLDIKGSDLIELGIDPGPEMGKILNDLLEMVIEDPKLNDKKRLKEIIKEKWIKG